jgi:DNA-binding transcriptional LysR family regulator
VLLLLIISSTHQWLGVEFRHLAALDAVARMGSFSAAAVVLGYTQSAVSQQIATLERIVGERLVERPGGPRPVSLTDAGRLLHTHAHAMVSRLGAAQADLAALSRGEAGLLRVGIYQSVGTRILPEIMRRFAVAWPRVEVRLTEAIDDAELLRLVERGELDLTFATLPLVAGTFDATELMRDPIMLLVAADSPLCDRAEPVPARLIAELPLIAYRATPDADLPMIRLSALGYQPRVVLRSDDNGTIHGLVGAGFGAALIPRLGVDPANPSTRALPIALRTPPRVIAIAWHRERYRIPAAEAFVEVARGVCAAVTSIS